MSRGLGDVYKRQDQNSSFIPLQLSGLYSTPKQQTTTTTTNPCRSRARLRDGAYRLVVLAGEEPGSPRDRLGKELAASGDHFDFLREGVKQPKKRLC